MTDLKQIIEEAFDRGLNTGLTCAMMGKEAADKYFPMVKSGEVNKHIQSPPILTREIFREIHKNGIFTANADARCIHEQEAYDEYASLFKKFNLGKCDKLSPEEFMADSDYE